MSTITNKDRKHGVRRHPPLRRIGAFNPDEVEPSPLITDLVRRINYWRSHPRRQEREQAMKSQNTDLVDGLPTESARVGASSSNDTSSALSSDIPPTMPPLTQKDASSDILPVRKMQILPRLSIRKPHTPSNLAESIRHVNEIWSVLKILPTMKSHTDNIKPYVHRSLPGICPYPNLRRKGFIQPRPGALLRTERRPEEVLKFSSKADFEEYIYSLAFHRDGSPRTGRMIMSAFFNRDNTPYFTETAFLYAFTFLIQRASDIYSARRLAEYMSLIQIPPSIQIYNLFLLASLNVESLQSFASTLREILNQKNIEADSTTWNLALRMGLKIESPNWVYSVLEVMESRKIPLDHEAIQAALQTLKGVVDSAKLKEYYLQQFQRANFVLWKPLNVVLHALCEDGKFYEAWELFLQASQKERPHAATLHLFIRMCRDLNDYDRAWNVIGEFSRRWHINPHDGGVTALFDFACQREEFSDALLIWGYAKQQSKNWKMSQEMVHRGKFLERVYGVPLDRPPLPDVAAEVWKDNINGRRNPDVYHLIPKHWKFHVRMMRARKYSEELPEGSEMSEDIRLWREIERIHDAAVASGIYKPQPLPRHLPDPNPQREYVLHGNKMKPVPMERIRKRIYLGLNFVVRGKVMVWEMVQRGAIKL
jgi:hypothetical protein